MHDYFVENAIASRTITTDEQWDEAMRVLLSYPSWKKFRCLLQKPEEDCTLQGALVKVCFSSILQYLAKRKSDEDREKFSEVLKENEHAVKSAKVKAAKGDQGEGDRYKRQGQAARDGANSQFDKEEQAGSCASASR
jgi:hypothetical protein